MYTLNSEKGSILVLCIAPGKLTGWDKNFRLYRQGNADLVHLKIICLMQFKKWSKFLTGYFLRHSWSL